MSMNDIKDVATIIGVIIAVVALILGILEHMKQGAQKRAEHFLTMRKRFKGNNNLKYICKLLLEDAKELADVSPRDKNDFLGFFEEVAIGMNSKFINPFVAHQMFGYYAIVCWESKYFWNNVPCNNMYYVVFKDFYNQMKETEKSFRFKRRNFRF